MLRRDYIMNLIRLFFEALGKFLRNKEGKDADILRPELNELYKRFLNEPRDYYYNLSVEEIIDSFTDEEKLYKLEIVAELFYQDALIGKEVNQQLLGKSLALFRYIDLNSDTFSFDRQRKVMEIESLLSL